MRVACVVCDFVREGGMASTASSRECCLGRPCWTLPARAGKSLRKCRIRLCPARQPVRRRCRRSPHASRVLLWQGLVEPPRVEAEAPQPG